MSNIRPIGDPAIATAMLATMQSIDAVRTAPSGLSEPRWRILQCIAKAAPNVPSPGELRLCSGLNKAALAEHIQALQWKGLLEMGGYRLSPSAAEMVGAEQLYPPTDAKAMAFHIPDAPPEHVEMLRSAIAALGIHDMPILPVPAKPVVVGADIAVEALVRVGDDGAVELVKVLSPLDPADVPACMRPDCSPPAQPIPAQNRCSETKKTNEHGRGSAAAARPIQRDVHLDRVAPDRAQRTTEEVAGSNPAPGQPAKPSVAAAATPPKFTNWIEERARCLDAAIRFLKSQAILVSVVDRDAQVRQYFVSGKRDRKFAEEVIEIAIEKGWVE